MAKTIFLTGGAASGKSRWAISRLADKNVRYLVTTKKIDSETEARIKYNSEQNNVTWDIRTDITANPVNYVKDCEYLILDNLASYVSDIIKRECLDENDMSPEVQKEIETRVIKDIIDVYKQFSETDGTLVIISLESGFSVMPSEKPKRMFREILGNVNQRIANVSDEVYLSVSGIQFRIK